MMSQWIEDDLGVSRFLLVIFDAEFTAGTLLPACRWKSLWEFHGLRSALCSP
jgi:hypothetical protein